MATYRITLGNGPGSVIRVINCPANDLKTRLFWEANRGGAGPVTKVTKLR